METLRDLIEEAKRRTILVAILVLIVAYIMSLTSSSVWINLPVSVVVLAALRRLSFEVEFRWKPRVSERRPQYPLHQNRRQLTNYDPLLSGLPCQVATTRWRRIIDSPVVEEAVDELTRAVIDEFVTSLWYTSITPDQEAPEELRLLLNGVIAEVAQRAKRVNLVTLLSKDVVDLVGSHFELFRQMKAKIGPDIMGSMSIDERDEKLKFAMITSRKLHPALISPEAEYKVLKKLTGGVVALVLKKQDSHCRLLRTLARELLACAVLRPVLNFASPGYINELIESVAIARERQRNVKAEELTHQRIPDPIPQKKPSQNGVEMTSLAPLESRKLAPDINPLQKSNENYSKIIGDVGTSTRSQPSHDTKSMKEVKGTRPVVPDTIKEVGANSTSNWSQTLDALAQRRAQALAPEHLDNVWAKGRNYKRRESEKSSTLASPTPVTSVLASNLVSPKTVEADMSPEVISGQEGELTSGELSKESTTSTIPMKADDDQSDVPSVPNKDKNAISDQYEALFFGDSKDGEEHLPGIGFSPLGTPRPNSRSPENQTGNLQARNIRGPQLSRADSNDNMLDSSANSQSTTETSGQSPSRFRYHHKSGTSSQRLRRAVRLLAHRKTKSSGGVSDGWNLDVGSSSQGLTSMLNAGEISPVTSPASESRWRSIRRSRSPDVSLAPVQVDVTEVMAHTQSTMLDCRVMGAHFERLGSKPFAVYTIRVQDTEERTWRIQRRFRNFEQLHRRLKDMPYYNLNLPPKRFLSSSLDSNFVRERCILLDKYLKDLLAIPSVAELHEVWDFLSLHSQHYTNGNSVSMMRTLAVNVDDAVDDMFRQIRGVSDDISGALKTATTGIRHRFPTSSGYMSEGAAFSSAEDQLAFTSRNLAPKYPAPYLTDSELSERLGGASVSEDEYGTLGGNVHGMGSLGWQSDSDVHLYPSDSEALKPGVQPFVSGKDLIQSRFLGSRLEGAFSDGHSPVESYASETVADDLGMPQEWAPPKVTVPILNLVDLIFQLQGRGWIRRQVLWIAKQILQLGMGDAIDDWLLGRIQWLCKEEVVASGIHWVKEMLWPDGIFVTKHPRNLPEASGAMLESAGFAIPEDIPERQQRPPLNSFEYRLEAARRAGLVREIILEKAPTAAVNLIGRKQYARCAKDIYYFSQSTVCVKQLTYSLLEMLLVNAFPELHDLILDVRTSVT